MKLSVKERKKLQKPYFPDTHPGKSHATNDLHHYHGSYRTPCGNIVYICGVCRVLTGEKTLMESVIRELERNGLRKVHSDLKVSFFNVESEVPRRVA